MNDPRGPYPPNQPNQPNQPNHPGPQGWGNQQQPWQPPNQPGPRDWQPQPQQSPQLQQPPRQAAPGASSSSTIPPTGAKSGSKKGLIIGGAVLAALVLVAAVAFGAFKLFTGGDHEPSHIAAGNFASCAVSGGEVYCWGDNGYLHLGVEETDTDFLEPTKIEGLSGITSIYANAGNACAVDSDGTPHCWGDSLSYWNGAKSATPVLIEGFTADEFRPGYFTSCGLRDGKVSCQGNNYFSHLGPQDRQFEVGEVVAIDGLPDIVELAPVGSTVYALDADGAVWAWGEAGDGGIPGATEDKVFPPMKIEGLPAASAIHSASWLGSQACIIEEGTGDVWCWGENGKGESGQPVAGDTAEFVAVPMKVEGVTGATALAGESGMVALLDDGTVVEWGRGVATMVGTDQWHVPRPVEGAADVVEIAAGAAHLLMVTSDGTIKAVGSNFSGQLGDGTGEDPKEVVDVKGIKAG